MPIILYAQPCLATMQNVRALDHCLSGGHFRLALHFVAGRLYSFHFMNRPKTGRTRLDALLVARGLADSAAEAQGMILAGEVLVNDEKISKAGLPVKEDATIRLLGKSTPFVSRAGIKLDHALNYFNVEVAGKICLDLGASTGGFTDCLLQRGAARVFAVDAGTNQLDWKIRTDPRVVALEQTNARFITFATVGSKVGFAAMDVSFISATMILPVLPELLETPGEVLVL